MDQQPPVVHDQHNSNDTVIAIIGYFIFFVPLLVPKRSKFLTFHANQALLLFLFSILIHIALSFFLIIPLLGLLLQLARIIPLVLLVIGIINAAGGQMKELPIIGGYTLIK